MKSVSLRAAAPSAPAARVRPVVSGGLWPVASGTAAVLLLSGIRGSAAPGDLDAGFGGTGRVVTTVGHQSQNEGRAVAIQSDGKVLVAGHYRHSIFGTDFDMAILRYLPDGRPDPSFNGDGKVIMGLPDAMESARDIAVQPDGKIVVASEFRSSPAGFFPAISLTRLLPDGRLDPEFGSAGQVLASPDVFAWAAAMAIQPDGKIVVAGSVSRDQGSGRCAILRFLPNGSPDPAFDDDGVVVAPLTDNTESMSSLALQNDGRIVVAGTGVQSAGVAFPDRDFIIARFLPDGRRDPAFNGTGTVRVRAGESAIPSERRPSQARAVAVQTDGKIVVGGIVEFGAAAMALVRLTTHGALDTTFNETGIIVSKIGALENDLTSLIVEPGGKIIAGGTVRFDSSDSEFGILRYLPDGRPDESLNGTGVVRTHFGSDARFSYCRDIALDPSRGLVAAGITSAPFSTTADAFALARYQLWYEGVNVEQPELRPLANNGTFPLDFGIVPLGSRTKEFLIRNPRARPLNALTVSVTGESRPGEFAFSQPLSTSLPPGGTTTFLVTFTPSAVPGVRTATLQVQGHDGAVQTFSAPLSGSRATASQTWRLTWFADPDNSGSGADLHDFDADGIVNLLEFATGAHPHQFTAPAATLVKNGDVLEYTYTRPLAALADLNYLPEFAGDTSGPWLTAGITSTVTANAAGIETVKATIPAPPGAPSRFVRLRVTRR